MDEDDQKLVAYNNMLQMDMIALLIKHESQNKKIISDILAVQKEFDTLQSQLFKLENRLVDVEWLSKLHPESDTYSLAVNNSLTTLSEQKLNNIAVKLQKQLKSISLLACEKIKLPETEEETEIFLDILKKCSATLQNMSIEFHEQIFDKLSVNVGNFCSHLTEIDSSLNSLTSTIKELQLAVLNQSAKSLVSSDK